MNEHKRTNPAQSRSDMRFPIALRNRKSIRWLLALLIGCVTAICIAARGYELLSIRIDGLPDLPYSDLIKDLIETKRDQSDELFDVALLGFGALFALMIAKKDEARIVLSDYPEIIMFVAAGALLAASLGCDVRYLGLMSDSLYTGGRSAGDSMPDMFGSAFEEFYTAQLVFLCGGLAAAAATLISAHRIKEAAHHV
jgi:uncharacterized membrane protein